MIKEKYLQQYSGVWAMDAPAFSALDAYVRGLDLVAHLESRARQPDDERESRGYMVSDNGVGVLELVGTFTKYGSSLTSGPAVVRARQAMKAALADESVRSLVLLIDSPGGSVAGIDDFGADVYRARQRKPVVAFIEDMGASAAYWIASQASVVMANTAAAVGSIGAYGVITDSSEAASRAGYKVHVVRSGKLKGAGVPGSPVTDEQLANAQRMVDAVHSLFVSSIARGRGLSVEHIENIADGRAFMAGEAQTLRLIDEIGTFSEAVDRAAHLSDSLATMKGQTMPDVKNDEQAPAVPPESGKSAEQKQVATPQSAIAPQSVAPAPASVAELRAALPGADAAFVLSCIEGGLTAAQAKAVYRPAAMNAPGGPGLPTSRRSRRDGEDEDTALARELVTARDEHEFIRAARALAKDEDITLEAAQSRIANADPDLYDAYRETFRVSPEQAKRSRARRGGLDR